MTDEVRSSSGYDPLGEMNKLCVLLRKIKNGRQWTAEILRTIKTKADVRFSLDGKSSEKIGQLIVTDDERAYSYPEDTAARATHLHYIMFLDP